MKQRTGYPVIDGLVVVPLALWVKLTVALEASPDISVADLTLKAKRLMSARKKYARQVVELEGRLLKKCPELDD